jgi:hypothetical protein
MKQEEARDASVSTRNKPPRNPGESAIDRVDQINRIAYQRLLERRFAAPQTAKAD